MPELEPARKPDRHCLLIDQGNSRLKWIGAVWTARSHNWDLDVTSFGEGQLEDFTAALDAGEMQPSEEILICSVALVEKLKMLKGELATRTSAKLTIVKSETQSCGISNGYSDPSQLGVDRWMAVLGSACHHGTPCVMMDLGTASTLDAVDQDGEHLGGLIIPGPETMLNSLGSKTALDINERGFLGRLSATPGQAQKTTAAAIQWGIATAQSSALQQFVTWVGDQLTEESKENLKVLVTGGAADVIIEPSDCPLIHDPLLVFKGILCSRFGRGKD